jgi:hypothetical protein
MQSALKVDPKIVRDAQIARMAADFVKSPTNLPAPAPVKKIKHAPTAQQLAAVEAAKLLEAGESLAIQANAGCGKTSLVKMLADTLEGDMVITAFSDKAVGEIKSRLKDANRNIQVRTFHSLCLNILSANGFQLSLECTDAERKSDPRRNGFKKTNRLQKSVMKIVNDSETINAQYLRAIGVSGWDLKVYAEAAVNRNGYRKGKGVNTQAIVDSEFSCDRKIGLDKPRNRQAYIQLIKHELLSELQAFLKECESDNIDIPIGLTNRQRIDFNKRLKASSVNVRAGKDMLSVVAQLIVYLETVKTFDLEGFREFYDNFLETKGYYAELSEILDENDLKLCHGSIIYSEVVEEYFENIEHLIDLEAAEENIYKTLALLCSKYIDEGLAIAKSESVICFYEMLLLCKLWPIDEIPIRYLIVDEAQDFSPMIHALLSVFVSEYTSLIVVGDPNQAIFQWAGAEKSSYQKLIDQFECEVLPLSLSFRCGENIIKYAQKYVPEIECGNDRIGKITVTDSPEFEGAYEYGDLVLGRSRLDVAKAYLEYMGSSPKIIAYSKGVNILSAVKDVSKQCIDEGNPIEDVYSFAAKNVTRIMKQLKSGVPGLRENYELFSIVKMAVGSLPRDRKFFSRDDLHALIEKFYPVSKFIPDDKDCIRFLTVHMAKGSEADRVICLDAKKFHPPATDNEDSEEARLSYVMVTRAREELIFCGGEPSGQNTNI